jgi:penicillin-binding protein 1A
VTTADGRLLYQRPAERGQTLVDHWVAAGITDLLQTAVNTGTGKAAQIGRPVAGKTGTTSSNKDGWFLGFSSGITTGVWMGRDDNKPVPGLQGGRNPARAFAQFMTVAVAKRPVEHFDVEATLPDWQIEPDDEAWYGQPGQMMVDPDGNPIRPSDPNAPAFPDPVASGVDGEHPEGQPSERLDQDWLDRAVGKNRTPSPQPREPAVADRRPTTDRHAPAMRGLPPRSSSEPAEPVQ